MASRKETIYSPETAADLIKIAALPETYEMALLKSDDHQKAYEQMTQSAQGIDPENIKLMRAGNTTSVMVYNPNDNSLTITFDPTLSKGTVFNNADKWDNFNRGKEEHSLGGQVHGGLYDDLVRDLDSMQFEGNLIDAINGVIYDFASQQDGPLSVNFTGFSKGGSQASLAAAEVVSSGIFDDPSIKLNNIYAFAPPAYGDQDFINNFNEVSQQLGANVWTVEYHGDIVPTILTPEAGNYFTQYDYNQFGNRAYFTGNNEGGAPSVAINPNAEELKTLREQPPPTENLHNSKSYIDMTESYKQGDSSISKDEPSAPTPKAAELNI